MFYPPHARLKTIFGAFLAIYSAQGLAISYTITDLGGLGGNSYATGINNSGQIIGMSNVSPGADNYHAFLYSDGVMQDLGTFGGSYSAATDINNSGQIVGWANLADDASVHGFLYDNGVMQDIGTLGGIDSNALGINDGGQVVGWAVISGSPLSHAFIYDGGVMQDLSDTRIGSNNVFTNTLGQGVPIASSATSINNSGQIIGRWSIPGTYPGVGGGFLLGDTSALTYGASGSIINDSGQIAGTYQPDNGYIQAFLYNNGTMTDIGNLCGDSTRCRSQAKGINKKGDVVGSSDVLHQDWEYHAFLYSDGVMTDLSVPLAAAGWTLASASAINDLGQIVGYGYTESDPLGRSHAFLLTPESGSTQDFPLLPTTPCDDSLSAGLCFTNVSSGQWFDPPITSIIDYVMDSSALFTGIAEFPAGFDSTFTVSSGGTVFGVFGPGQSLAFPGAGVSAFTISGISPTVDLANGNAFPLKLNFSQPTASFHMYGGSTVPEPETLLLFATGLGLAARFRHREKTRLS